jgi:hypothetical protein
VVRPRAPAESRALRALQAACLPLPLTALPCPGQGSSVHLGFIPDPPFAGSTTTSADSSACSSGASCTCTSTSGASGTAGDGAAFGTVTACWSAALPCLPAQQTSFDCLRCLQASALQHTSPRTEGIAG